MNELPSNNKISVEILSSIFNDTTNSYKYYWFLSILEVLQSDDNDEILIDDLCERMIESVWYPLNFFKLSFGKQDHFKNIANLINSSVDLENSYVPIIQKINNSADEITQKQINAHIKKLARWVPYRFIRPFFRNELSGIADPLVNSTIIKLSRYYSKKNSNIVPYYFMEEKIVLNKPWKDYLMQNIGLLKGFTYWKLVNFVQKNNPNVLGISSKLFKPEKRNLALNIKSWDFYFKLNNGIRCIYSNEQVPENFSLDHFVPWSYTVHDFNWNILPVSKEINSQKSNNLPALGEYLIDFVSLQNDFIKCIYNSNFEHKSKILEHYCLLFKDSSSNICNMSKQSFETKLTDTIQPMVQIATNMGFNKNWILKF